MREFKLNPGLDYKPIGFVDDDLTKLGIKIHGRKVLGTTDDITALVEKHKVKCMLIAIPSATGKEIDEIVHKCSQSKVEYKIFHGVDRRIDGELRLNRIRQVRLEDLLGRPPVRLDLGNIQKKLEGETVLITGAGGSIGWIGPSGCPVPAQKLCCWTGRKTTYSDYPVNPFKTPSAESSTGGRRYSGCRLAAGSFCRPSAAFRFSCRRVQACSHDGNKLLPGGNQQYFRYIQRCACGPAI